MNAAKRVTQAEFARLNGVNRSTVTRWVQNGRVQVDAHGLLDPVAAAALRDATESPEPHHQARKAQFDEQRAQNAAGQGATPSATGATAGQNGPTARFSDAGGGEAMPQAEKLGIALKIAMVKYKEGQAEDVNIKIDKEVKTLALRSEFEFALADFSNTLRAQLENLPGRLAGPLAALHSDASLIHTALQDEFRNFLHDMDAAAKRQKENFTP